MTESEKRIAVQMGANPVLLEQAIANLASASAVASPATNTGLGILKNPFQVPMQLVMVGTNATGSGKSNFFIDDACGLAGAYGSVGTASGIAFVPSNITAAVLKEWLKTYALVIDGYNFNSSDSTKLSNNLTAIYTSLDGNSSRKQLFSASTVSNMQYNANLLNVNQSFVYTNDCALLVTAASPDSGSLIYTFTFKIKGAVPYGKLDEYLADAKIPERSRMTC